MEKRAKRAEKATTHSKRAKNSNMECGSKLGKTSRHKNSEMEASKEVGKTTRSRTNASRCKTRACK